MKILGVCGTSKLLGLAWKEQDKIILKDLKVRLGNSTIQKRLKYLYNIMKPVLNKLNPDIVVLEQIRMGSKNPQQLLYYIECLILLTVPNNNCKIQVIDPNEYKKILNIRKLPGKVKFIGTICQKLEIKYNYNLSDYCYKAAALLYYIEHTKNK